MGDAGAERPCTFTTVQPTSSLTPMASYTEMSPRKKAGRCPKPTLALILDPSMCPHLHPSASNKPSGVVTVSGQNKAEQRADCGQQQRGSSPIPQHGWGDTREPPQQQGAARLQPLSSTGGAGGICQHQAGTPGVVAMLQGWEPRVGSGAAPGFVPPL